MTSLRTRDIVALGFMTFALFIGAGNIIFPPIVAQQAGEHVWLAAFGFLITAVGLPVITIIALSRVEGSIQILSSPLGKIASLILTITCYLTVGPLFATPRTATVSYEIGFSSYLGTSSSSLLIYSAIYFSVVTLISLYPNKILDTVGYVLSPLKILSLAILGIAAMMIPTGFVPPAINNYIDSPVSEGFVNGYLTMDTLGALVFGIVIIQAIRSRGVSNPKLITRYAVIASPISGIGILGIIISSLVVYGIATANDLFATQAGVQFATAMALFMTSVVVCIAAISNDNLQDLKTGQLVGATPWRQQVALLIGSVVGAVAIAPVLNLLYQAYGFTGAMPRAEMDAAQALSAPQATLMTTIAQGIFSSSLDWTYILIGVGVGIVAIIVNLILKSTTATLSLPPLAIGMGIYLPPTLEMPLVMGSVISYFVGRYLVQQARQRSGELADLDVEQSNRRGVLFASGLIVGESLIGVIIAVIIVLSVTSGGSEAPLSLVGPEFESTAEWLGLAAFVAVAIYMIRLVVTHKFDKAEALAMKEEQEK